jgi:hypothetical protein
MIFPFVDGGGGEIVQGQARPWITDRTPVPSDPHNDCTDNNQAEA